MTFCTKGVKPNFDFLFDQGLGAGAIQIYMALATALSKFKVKKNMVKKVT